MEEKILARANQCRASIRLWRAQHEKHNDVSSRRLLVNALLYACGAFDTLDALGLYAPGMRQECEAWAQEARDLQTEKV